MRNFVYKHGKIAYFDYVNLDWFNKFLLDNALKMLRHSHRMRYLYKVEKKRVSEPAFWLVSDGDFMNFVKLFKDRKIAELWRLLVVEYALFRLTVDIDDSNEDAFFRLTESLDISDG